MIKFRCSQCGEELEAPESLKNERLQCPKCRYPERIPDSDQSPPAIVLEGGGNVTDDPAGDLSQIRTFQSESELEEKRDYKRPLNITGKGATRCRTFHIRLSDKAMKYLDEQINDWTDQNPDIEIKFANTVIGEVEGKKIEPHLIVTVWY